MGKDTILGRLKLSNRILDIIAVDTGFMAWGISKKDSGKAPKKLSFVHGKGKGISILYLIENLPQHPSSGKELQNYLLFF